MPMDGRNEILQGKVHLECAVSTYQDSTYTTIMVAER